MHDEDNQNCLFVSNLHNNKWWACGDHRFFDAENYYNRYYVNQAMKAIVDQIRVWFDHGTLYNGAGAHGPPDATVAVDVVAWLPRLPTDNHGGLTPREQQENTCPLYRINPDHSIDVRRLTDIVFGLPRPANVIDTVAGSSIRDAVIAALATNPPNPALYIAAPPAPVVPAVIVPGVGAADCAYTPFLNKDQRNSDCCSIANRATPQFSDDAGTSGGHPVTECANPWSTVGKRCTYTNICFTTQEVGLKKRATMRGISYVGHLGWNGLQGVGNGLVSVGNGAWQVLQAMSG